MGAVLAIASLAGLVFIPVLGTLGAVSFLAAGCGLCALNPSRVVERCIRDWPILLLAVFCTLSVMWSREPAMSLRFGIQLTATVVIALAIAERLAPRDFCLAMGGFLSVAMILSIGGGGVSGATAAWTGIYGSKNAFAGAASTFVLIAFGLSLAQGSGLLRFGFLLAAVVGCVLVLFAQSVGAMTLLVVTLVCCGATMAVARLGRTATATMLAGTILLTTLAALAASANVGPLSQALLQSTGKDLTLTGRTELWAVAVELISERPLLGVGYQAFWVKGNAEAEALWHIFGIENRTGFNFHNMYLSNAVEIGVVGVAIQAYILLGAAILAMYWTFRTASPIAAVFLGLTLTVVLGSLIEVPLFFQFSLRTVLVIATFVYARDALCRGA